MVSQIMEGLPQKTSNDTDVYSEKSEDVSSADTGVTTGIDIAGAFKFNVNHKPLSNLTARKEYTLRHERTETIQFDNNLSILEKALSDKNLVNNEIYSNLIKDTAAFDFCDTAESRRFLFSDFYKSRYQRTVDKSLEKLELLEYILPYKYFAVNNKYVIPINKRYLRTSFKNLQLNYQYKVTVLGLKNQKISKALNQKHITLLNDYNTVIQDAVKTIFGDSDPYVIDVFALYF